VRAAQVLWPSTLGLNSIDLIAWLVTIYRTTSTLALTRYLDSLPARLATQTTAPMATSAALADILGAVLLAPLSSVAQVVTPTAEVTSAATLVRVSSPVKLY
jgi:hypothetical protein